MTRMKLGLEAASNMFATPFRACTINFYRSSNFLFKTGVSTLPTSTVLQVTRAHSRPRVIQ